MELGNGMFASVYKTEPLGGVCKRKNRLQTTGRTVWNSALDQVSVDLNKDQLKELCNKG